jgi:cytoplasmic iron level regulating protein YaaA (DUF328/UPF0246 family)
MTTETFTNEIKRIIDEARNKGEEYVVIKLASERLLDFLKRKKLKLTVNR